MRFHHVGVVVGDIDQATNDYAIRMGGQVTSAIVEDQTQGARVVLLTVGSDTLIELVEPLNTQSSLNKVLRRRAPLHHLCFEVDDLDQEIERLRNLGLALVAEPVSAPLFDMRRIAWLCDESGGLMELLEAE